MVGFKIFDAPSMVMGTFVCAHHRIATNISWRLPGNCLGCFGARLHGLLRLLKLRLLPCSQPDKASIGFF